MKKRSRGVNKWYPYTLRIPPDLEKTLRDRMDKEHRTGLSETIIAILLDCMEKKK